MASVSRIGKSNTFRILFNHPRTDRRVEFLVPNTTVKQANIICFHIERILSHKKSGQPLEVETSVWIKNLPDHLRKKLARKEIVEQSKMMQLGDFVRTIFLNRKDVQNSTFDVWQQTINNLFNFFGETISIHEITPGQADQFYQDLCSQGLAPITVAKRISFAKTIFNTALRHKLISENPFLDIKPQKGDTSKRQHYIDPSTALGIMKGADPNWRIIIALCRFGGLRCPSEVLSLRWADIDLENGWMTVQSPKTKRYDGKDKRTIPIFGPLRPFLEEAIKLSPPDQIHVVGGNYLAKSLGDKRWRNCNIRKRMETLVKNAGYNLWPRLFHNLRSSCETDMLSINGVPVKAVANWFGHSVEIAMNHYAQVTQNHHKLASEFKLLPEQNISPHFPPQQPPASGSTEKQIFNPSTNQMRTYAERCKTTQTYELTNKRRGRDSNPR